MCDMLVTAGKNEREGGRERKGTCDRERGLEEGEREVGGGGGEESAYVSQRTIRGVHDTSPGVSA